jgi:hypothetical protein
VPSLSKVAMRSGTGTKSGEPGVATFVTKSMMDCFALPSFHDGSGSAARAMVVKASAQASATAGMFCLPRIAFTAFDSALPRAQSYSAAAPFCSCCNTLLMLKLPVSWLGGNSLNEERKLPTRACAGTRTNAWSKIQSQYVLDVMSARS